MRGRRSARIRPGVCPVRCGPLCHSNDLIRLATSLYAGKLGASKLTHNSPEGSSARLGTFLSITFARKIKAIKDVQLDLPSPHVERVCLNTCSKVRCIRELAAVYVDWAGWCCAAGRRWCAVRYRTEGLHAQIGMPWARRHAMAFVTMGAFVTVRAPVFSAPCCVT